jgi:hypothetical protein
MPEGVFIPQLSVKRQKTCGYFNKKHLPLKRSLWSLVKA